METHSEKSLKYNILLLKTFAAPLLIVHKYMFTYSLAHAFLLNLIHYFILITGES